MGNSNNKVGDTEISLKEKYTEFGQPYSHDTEFKGPGRNRSCTDVLCLILYIVFTLLGFVVAVFAYYRGNPALLAYPTDTQGKVCGFNDMENRKYLMFFDLMHCIRNLHSLPFLGCPTTQLCVEKCPGSHWSWMSMAGLETNNGVDINLRERDLICVDEVDWSVEKWATMKLSDLVAGGYCAAYTLPQEPVLQRCMPSFLVESMKGDAKAIEEGNVTLYNDAGKIISTGDLGSSKGVVQALLDMQQWGDKVLADIRATWPHMLFFVAVALIVSFLWILLLRFMAGVLVWVTIILFGLIWFFGLAFALWRYNLLTNFIAIPTPPGELAKFTAAISFKTTFDSPKLWLAVAIICGVILLVFLLVLCFLGSRIRLAVKLFEEASKAMTHMPSTLLWPFIPFSIQLTTIAWAAAAGVCLATLGRAEFISTMGNSSEGVGLLKLPKTLTDCDYGHTLGKIANWSDNVVVSASDSIDSSLGVRLVTSNQSSFAASTAVHKINATLSEVCRFLKYGGAEYAIYLQFYNLFMFFWHWNFIAGLGMVTLAGAFGSYYWAFEKPKDIPKLPLFTGLWRAIRYHMGSVAFGSLLIAIVQLIRVILEYIMMKMKETRNFAGAFILRCIQCCFYCLEQLVKFVARKAYIMIAIHGYNFCSGAKNAWQLVMRNIVRAAVLTGVSRFLIVLSVLIVTGAMITFSYFYFHGEIPAAIPVLMSTWPNLNYFYVPVVLVAVASFAIASVCFLVYDIGVETMFMCFLEDCERNDGSAERPYFMSKNLASALR